MKKIRLGVVAALATGALTLPAYAQTGNGAPSGRHYNLNIIGVDKGKTAPLTGSNRHTIFVALNNRGDVSSRIYLVPGAAFRVCDGNAFDPAFDCSGNQIRNTGAVFMLPCNTNLEPGTDPDGEPSTLIPCDDTALEPTLAYEVWARALGKPGGDAIITTCATETVDIDNDGTLDEECSTENVVLVRNPGKSTFSNVTQELTSLVVCFDVDPTEEGEDIDCFRYALFTGGLEDWFWNYDNNGLRLAQIRFYPL
jgi:hypothetical protein